MATYNTPGVYIEEVPRLPPSVADVETGVPVFIGGTATGSGSGPLRIDSLADCERHFGGPPIDALTVRLTGTGAALQARCDPPAPSHLLHHALRLFFANGGTRCFVSPGGDHGSAPALAPLRQALDAVADLEGAALLLCPDAVRLPTADYALLVQAMLAHCAQRGDRFALLDLHPAAADLAAARALLGSANLSRGAAYHPALRAGFGPPALPTRLTATATRHLTLLAPDGERLQPARLTAPATLRAVRAAIAAARYVLPPSGAIAGACASTDRQRGVWKAPANIALLGVDAPALAIDDAAQAQMQVEPEGGRGINAIRTLPGKGCLVWGARTLAGNDNEWRYVQVRRFFDMVQASLQRGLAWAVFEPNDANTWARLRAQADNYLTLKWRAGALQGAKPEHAFYVRCGLGQTMNTQDLERGTLIVEIGLAVVRPAEFIICRLALKLEAG